MERTWVRFEWDAGPDDLEVIERLCEALALPGGRNGLTSVYAPTALVDPDLTWWRSMWPHSVRTSAHTVPVDWRRL